MKKKVFKIIILLVIIISASSSYVVISYFSSLDEIDFVNCSESTYYIKEFELQFLRTNIVFILDNQKVVSEMEKLNSHIEKTISNTLHLEKIEDIEKSGAEMIKRKIISNLNKALKQGEIINFWFAQLVVKK